MKKNVLVGLLAAAGLILLVLGFVLLPEQVATQLNTAGQAGNRMPKPLALAIPTLVTGLFGYLYYTSDNRKHLVGALVGLLLFGMMFWLNR